MSLPLYFTSHYPQPRIIELDRQDSQQHTSSKSHRSACIVYGPELVLYQPQLAYNGGTPSPVTKNRPMRASHLATREIKCRRTDPLIIKIFNGHLADFVEDYSPDAVISSCLKGSFDFPDTKSSFNLVAGRCGIATDDLTYHSLNSVDKTLHFINSDVHCKCLWLLELEHGREEKQLAHHLVKYYELLKTNASLIIGGDVQSVALPLIGANSAETQFTNVEQAIIELIGWLYFVSENVVVSDKARLQTVNVVCHNAETAALFDKHLGELIPFDREHTHKLVEELSAKASSWQSELKVGSNKAESSDKGARRSRGQVQIVKMINKSVDAILSATGLLLESPQLAAANLAITSCAVNGKIIGELCAQLFLMNHREQAIDQSSSGSSNGNSRGSSSSKRGKEVENGHTTFSMKKKHKHKCSLSESILELSPHVSSEVLGHFQTLRMVGVKAVHSTLHHATLVDLAAVVRAVNGILIVWMAQ